VRSLIVLVLSVAASVASAQATKSPSTKGAPATKTAATSSQKAPAGSQKAAPATSQKGGPAASQKAPPTASQKAAPIGTKTGAAQRRPVLAVAPETTARIQVPVIMREVFDYDAAGRRDPFTSLLSSEELRPTVADLRLVIVLFDESGRRPVAVMRDVTTNAQYRVTTGMTLGRLRVTSIRPRAVFFTIEEFGLSRQDSIRLGNPMRGVAK
jgi:hypothetical protein